MPKTTGTASQLLVRTVDLPPELRTGDIPPGVGTADLTTVVRADEVPPVGRMVTVQPDMPPDSVSMVAFDDSEASSVPMSPNQVRVDVSQDIPDEGTVFEVSPDTSGYLMRSSGASARTPVANFPFPPAVNPFSDPVFGDPIAFAQFAMIPRSDTPMTLPVYTKSSGLSLMPGQSCVETIVESAESSQVEGWSAGTPQTDDVSREGPLTPIRPRWIRGIAPRWRWACRVVRIRLRHVRGRQSLIPTRHLECNFIIPGFWSLSGHRSHPSFFTNPRRFGFNRLCRNLLRRCTMSTEMMSLGLGQVVFPSEEVAALSTTPSAPREARYMAEMGLWRSQSGPGDPGPVPASSSNA